MNSDYSDDVTNSNSGNRALDALAAIRARARPTQENSPSLGDLREETSQVGPRRPPPRTSLPPARLIRSRAMRTRASAPWCCTRPHRLSAQRSSCRSTPVDVGELNGTARTPGNCPPRCVRP